MEQYIKPSVELLSVNVDEAMLATSLQIGGEGKPGDVAETKGWNVFSETDEE